MVVSVEFSANAYRLDHVISDAVYVTKPKGLSSDEYTAATSVATDAIGERSQNLENSNLLCCFIDIALLFRFPEERPKFPVVFGRKNKRAVRDNVMLAKTRRYSSENALSCLSTTSTAAVRFG